MWIADYISYKGKTTFIAAYRGSELVWKKQGSIPECGEPMRVIFDVTNNIMTYTKRDYNMVFDKTEQQWYILNDNNDYEKYGIIEEINSFDETNAEWGYTTDQWTTSSTVVFNGKAYTRYCNKDISDNGSAISTITISGYKTFVLYVCTSGESNYDYMCVSNLDKQVSKLSTTNDNIKWSGYGKYVESSGTENINNYTRLEFNTDGGTHTIQVGYFKDGSVSSNDDSGYFVVINEENVSGAITTYNGKLVHYLPTYHEYEWNGTEWIDLGSTACSNVYTYKFLNWDGTVLQEGNVLEGETPEYTGGTPTRPEDDNYTYEFVYWNPEPEPLYEDMTFTAVYNEISYDNDDITLPYVAFRAEEAGSTLGLAKIAESPMGYDKVEYSTDKTTWTNLSTSKTITLANVGDEVYVRISKRYNLSDTNYTRFKMTGKIAAYGNVMALLDYTDLNKSVREYGFFAMFQNCTALTKAPKLPATTLANSCYRYMFNGCSSLVEAPELPATTLAFYCYHFMFADCTSLVNAPELPAINLAEGCYHNMFRGCTLLNSNIILPAEHTDYFSYTSMFRDCKSLKNVKIFAKVLYDDCFTSMFEGCTAIEEITCLAEYYSYNAPTGTQHKEILYSGSNCFQWWLSSTNSTGTFYRAPGIEWPTGGTGIPSGWTVLDYTA